MNNEILAKARMASSPEELLKIAKENGQDFTEENAEAYYKAMHKSGELTDEELENAVGGCKKGGRRIVSSGLLCPNGSSSWECKTCHNKYGYCTCGRKEGTGYYEYAFDLSVDFGKQRVCGSCAHCSYESGVWYCNDAEANAK